MKYFNHKQFWLVGLLVVADIIIFAGTDATKVTSFIVMVGYLLLVLTIFAAIFGILSLSRLYGIPIKHKKRFAAYITGMIGLLVALQSIGELSSRDILVILPLVIIAYAYSSYSRSDRRNLEG